MRAHQPLLRVAPCVIKMSLKSLTLVNVGPVITESPKASKAMPVVAIKADPRVDILGSGARQTVRVEIRAGDLFRTVDAVGISGNRVDTRMSVERNAKRQQELDI